MKCYKTFTREIKFAYKDNAVISFAASKDKSLESNLLRPDGKKTLLPAISLYGANAAGKSNVLHALMTMKDMVIGDASKTSKGQKLPWEPFGVTNEPTTFEVVFIYAGIRYAYGYSFDDKQIYSEYLYHWPNGREALIFSRKNGKYEFRNYAEKRPQKLDIYVRLLGYSAWEYHVFDVFLVTKNAEGTIGPLCIAICSACSIPP